MRYALGALFGIGAIAALVIFALVGKAPQSVRHNILVVASDPTVAKLTKGIDKLLSNNIEIARRLDIQIRAPSNTLDNAALPSHDLLIFEVLDPRWTSTQAELLKSSNARIRLAVGPSGLPPGSETLQPLSLISDDVVNAYWLNSSPTDIANMFSFIAKRYLGESIARVDPPRPALSKGFALFDKDRVNLVPNWEDWQKQNGGPKKPRIGILEYSTRARAEEMEIPRALSVELQKLGLQPVVAFAHRAAPSVTDLFLNDDGTPRVDALISLHHKFFEGKNAEVLAAIGIPVINGIRVFGRTYEEWLASSQGLTSSEVAWQLAVPELAGLSPHMVLGAIDNRENTVSTVPIRDRVLVAAQRALQLSRIRNTKAENRKVAILYWNYPPGKHNVGASYLNVLESIPKLLRWLKGQGYNVTEIDTKDDKEISDAVRRYGLNIGRYAPGELQRLIETKEVVTIPASVYSQWFSELPDQFRRTVTDHWKSVSHADIMTTKIDGEVHLVLPILKFGNIVVMPQPDRARSQDLEALYHAQDLPPHHQYIAAYLWLQKEFRADAVIHTGTHGTHEWLSGKEAGLSGSDAGEVLAGPLHILYPYIVDDIGEGIVAKRRGAATIVSHLTPALGGGGLSPELGAISQLLNEWNESKTVNPERAEEIAELLEKEVKLRGLDLDLSDKGWSSADLGSRENRFYILKDYLEEVRSQTIPFGLHTFGLSPSVERLQQFVDKMAEAHGDGIRAEAQDNLIASGPSELDGLRRGLEARYVLPGPGNDPIRNPEAIPTGKNFASFDPRKMPVAQSDHVGKQLAERLIESHIERTGAVPRKVALQLWGVEMLRHQGVQEAQGLALLGVNAVRDKRGRILKLELISREKLGRPRVDVVFHATSLYRDTFPMLVELLDQAVRLAASSQEVDNPIRANATVLERQLVEAGVSEEEAKKRSLLRIFAEPTGKHDSKIFAMTHASGSWDNEQQVADNYIRRMGHAYGGGLWGVPATTEFHSALKGTDTIVHTRSSNLYATLDNDDYFSYGGSIALGVRRANWGGKSPPFYVTDLRKPGSERHVTLERFMGQELRARYLNPKFAKEMMKEGYAGGRHIWKAVEYLWGWQVVYPEAVDAAKWQELHDFWIKDRNQLGTQKFFETHNPFATQAIAARMLEVIRKGYWQPDEEIQRSLLQNYVESIVRHGPSCDHLSCDNPELQHFVQKQATNLNAVPKERLSAALQKIEEATGQPLADALAKREVDKTSWHTPKPTPVGSNKGETSTDRSVTGYRLTEESLSERVSSTTSDTFDFDFSFAKLIALLVIPLFGFIGGLGRARTTAMAVGN